MSAGNVQRTIADLHTPIGAFARLGEFNPVFLLENVEHEGVPGRYSVIGLDPISTITYDSPDKLEPAGKAPFLEMLRGELAKLTPAEKSGIRLPAGLVGVTSFEMTRELAGIPETLVLFEAPHRIRRTLEDLLDLLGDRQVALARELTKIHEECRLGRLSQILQELPQMIRGELTLVVQGPEDNRPGQQVPREEDLLREIESSPGRSTGQAVREVARRHGLSSRDAYNLWVRKGGKGRSTRKSPKK